MDFLKDLVSTGTGRPSDKIPGIEYKRVAANMPVGTLKRLKVALASYAYNIHKTQDSLISAAINYYLDSFNQDDSIEDTESLPDDLYFMEYAGKIKIGRSNNPERRANEIGVNLGEVPKILKVVKGAGCYESQIHKAFAAFRTKGEWFEINAEILQFMLNCEEIINEWG